ncbi:MAG TPA: 3-dehydroquinate synthase [Caldilineae bacterium]|nr:3-dehydroquinate synthase [Caldilineae bacterium]
MPSSRLNNPPNIVLTGFMGVGKTAVGRAAATQLGRPFVDMDDLIVAEAGMSIPEIFDRHGEAHFRNLERTVLRRLAAEQGMVIATGGGALVDAANRELMTRTSLVVCLSAAVSAIEERIGADANRPLLATPDRQQRIVDLLSQRAAAYAEIPYRIDTTGRSVQEVAAEVVELAERGLGGVLRLPVSTPDGGGYDILVGAGQLAELPNLLDERGLTGAVAIITDENVAPHWADRLLEPLRSGGYPAILITLPAGETHKNLATIARIYDDLVAAGIDRSGLVIALGGGVVGDMAGFAAATYLRGVRFVQIPTTLLAMVDASVGGKTGVDLPQGKNLVGAFKQPELVVVDPDLLATLPPAEFRNGLGEVVKHGIIADPALFAQLQADGPESLESMLARALRVKIGVVERDPFEQGERAHLNLGHTFAHAFEQVSRYAIPHGQAVGVGLIASAHLSVISGHCQPTLPDRIADVLDRLLLPTRFTGLDPAALVTAMSTDKKRKGGRVRFVLPHEIGRVAVHDDIEPEQVTEALNKVLV